MNKMLAGLASVLLTTPLLTAGPSLTPEIETPQLHHARMEWWREAKFGMFIHWGVYSVPAGEWDGKTDYAE